MKGSSQKGKSLVPAFQGKKLEIKVDENKSANIGSSLGDSDIKYKIPEGLVTSPKKKKDGKEEEEGEQKGEEK